MQCDYFDAGVCRSCALLETPYARQLAAKEDHVREVLARVADGARWLPPVASAEQGFRTKAKMVVAGTVDAPRQAADRTQERHGHPHGSKHDQRDPQARAALGEVREKASEVTLADEATA